MRNGKVVNKLSILEGVDQVPGFSKQVVKEQGWATAADWLSRAYSWLAPCPLCHVCHMLAGPPTTLRVSKSTSLPSNTWAGCDLKKALDSTIICLSKQLGPALASEVLQEHAATH